MDNIVETFITIAFVAIAFISWVIRLVGQSGEEAKAQARQQQQRRERPARQTPRPADRATNSRQAAASEIDSFLRQATAAPAKPAEEEIEIEIIPDEELRERERDVRQRESRAGADSTESPDQRTDWDRQYETRRDRLRSAIAERQLETTPLATELKEHVERTMAEAAAIANQRDHAERELADTRARIRTLEGGAAATADAVSEFSGARTSDVAALLRNPATVKNAIIINEILGRPRALGR